MADFFSGPQNNRPQNQRKDLIRVMGLWEENDQNGNKMLTGTLSGRVKVNIVPNNFKKGDREPDYYLTVAQYERTDNPGEGGQPQPEEPQQRCSIRLTGLWRNRDSKGKDYLSGSLQSLRILIFNNNYHQSGSDPDYILYVCQSTRPQGQQGQGQGGFGGGFGSRGGFGGGFGGDQGGFGSSQGGAQDSGFESKSGDPNEYNDPPF
jgi:uncharacterized protein (DUF736 family)